MTNSFSAVYLGLCLYFFRLLDLFLIKDVAELVAVSFSLH